MIPHFFQRTLLLLIALTFIISSCSEESPEEFQINPEFQKHISSFTSGVISAAAPIKIQLTEPYSKKIIPNQAIKDDFIKISPAVKGKTVWSDQYTLRSEEHTSELQSRPHLVCRLLLEKKK